jgi:two-component system, OmpR family, sensor kinase
VRLLTLPVDEGRVLTVGVSARPLQDARQRLLMVLLVAAPLLLAALGTGGWLVVRAALRPVDMLAREAAEISSLESDRRLPGVPGDDEIARLAQTLDGMLDRLRAAFERERGFVDDASHELRTPLAVLKAELDLALTRPRPPDQLREALKAASTHTDELVRLAEDLLVLARMRGGRLPLHRVPTDLPAMLERAVDPLRPVAAATGRTLRIEAPDVQVCLDPLRTRQAVLNLVDNALRHGRGTVTVTASSRPSALSIDVGDEGDGFPADLANTAFEPFVRGTANSPGPKGAGLGLAIVQAVAAAHGGRARVMRRPGGGASVRVELPLEPRTTAGPARSGAVTSTT